MSFCHLRSAFAKCGNHSLLLVSPGRQPDFYIALPDLFEGCVSLEEAHHGFESDNWNAEKSANLHPPKVSQSHRALCPVENVERDEKELIDCAHKEQNNTIRVVKPEEDVVCHFLMM